MTNRQPRTPQVDPHSPQGFLIAIIGTLLGWIGAIVINGTTWLGQTLLDKVIHSSLWTSLKDSRQYFPAMMLSLVVVLMVAMIQRLSTLVLSASSPTALRYLVALQLVLVLILMGMALAWALDCLINGRGQSEDEQENAQQKPVLVHSRAGSVQNLEQERRNCSQMREHPVPDRVDFSQEEIRQQALRLRQVVLEILNAIRDGQYLNRTVSQTRSRMRRIALHGMTGQHDLRLDQADPRLIWVQRLGEDWDIRIRRVLAGLQAMGGPNQ